MSAEAAALTRSWAVGQRTVTMTVPRPTAGRAAACAIEWAPDAPEHLTATELDQYRRGRDSALRDLAAQLEIRIAVVDL